MSNRSNRKAWIEAAGVKPKEVNGQWTLRTQFYKDYLYNIISACFNIKTSIETDIEYMKWCLIVGGFVGALDSNYGLLLYLPNVYGLNMYNQPNKARYVIIGTGENIEREIGENTEIVYLNRLRGGGFMPLIDIYAYKLASVDASIDMNLLNSRTPVIIAVENSQQKATVERMYDESSQGKPLVIMRRNADGSTPIENASLDLNANFITDKLQDAKRTIINEFLTMIGVNNSNTDKRERLISDEVHANDVELEINIKLIQDNLKMCCEKVNSMFPDMDLSITYEPPKAEEKEVSENADV